MRFNKLSKHKKGTVTKVSALQSNQESHSNILTPKIS